MFSSPSQDFLKKIDKFVDVMKIILFNKLFLFGSKNFFWFKEFLNFQFFSLYVSRKKLLPRKTSLIYSFHATDSLLKLLFFEGTKVISFAFEL